MPVHVGARLPIYLPGRQLLVSGRPVAATLVYGAELLSAAQSDLEGNYTAGQCDALTQKGGSPTLAQSADAYSGSKAQQITAVATNNTLGPPLVAGVARRTVRGGGYAKRTAGTGGGQAFNVVEFAVNSLDSLRFTAATYTLYTRALYCSTTADVGVRAYERDASSFDTILIDALTLQRATLASSGVYVGDARRRHGTYECHPTAAAASPRGMAICCDDDTNPAYELQVFTNGTNVTLINRSAGSEASPIDTAVGVTYAAGRTLRVVIAPLTGANSSVKVYYESAVGVLTQIGATQTINLLAYGTKVRSWDPAAAGNCGLTEMYVGGAA